MAAQTRTKPTMPPTMPPTGGPEELEFCVFVFVLEVEVGEDVVENVELGARVEPWAKMVRPALLEVEGYVLLL